MFLLFIITLLFWEFTEGREGERERERERESVSKVAGAVARSAVS